MRGWLAVSIAVLYGCTPAPASPPPPQKTFSEALSKSPSQRSYQLDGHELLVIDVPSYAGGKYVEMQRCYIWRDAEYKTASLQCPGEASDVLPAGGQTADAINP